MLFVIALPSNGRSELTNQSLDEAHEAKMPVSIAQPCDDDGAIRPAVRFYQRQIDTLEIVEGDAISAGA